VAEPENEITEITHKNQRMRLLEIVRVMRQHDFLRNFLKQQHPEEIRQALEDLGPTFIKAGQLLSTRPDLISPPFIKEFRKLQDDVSADSYSTVQKTFADQTGKQIEDVFSTFAKEPFASASIGQTHRATLKDGTNVVVKIQHPDVQKLVATDLALFSQALRITKFVPEMSVVDPYEVFEEVRRSLLSEINTENEVKNGSEFYRLNNHHGIFLVPQVYEEYSTQKILVSDEMPGVSIKKIADQPLSRDLKKAAHQKKMRTYLAKALVENFIKQVFTDHFFHADPHPGNILFWQVPEFEPHIKPNHSRTLKASIKPKTKLPNYRLIYLDFGIMGHLTPNLADGIANVVLALNTKEPRTIGQALLTICNRTGEVDQEDFYDQLAVFLTPYLHSGLGEIDFSTFIYEIIKLCRQNNLQAKPEVTLLVKAFGLLEGLVAQLDPELSMMDVARPFGRKYLQSKFNLKNEAEDALMNLTAAAKAVPQLPIKVEKVLDLLLQGQGRMNIRYKGQENLLNRLEQIINRLMVTIVLAAIILSSSLLVQGSVGHPAIYKIGVSGYLISFVIIILLILDEMRRYFKHKK
jgi:ubiquinone biosynthesis protein